jgi:NAD(P)-dependent dehydrogenase (short-subunit alcohol dehydrogenase family)
LSTIVITGGGSGVGRAVALKFAGAGWNLAVTGRGEAALHETIALGGTAAAARSLAVPCDVTRPADVDAMAAAVLGRFGAVDVLVNSAGINVPRRSLRELSREDWDAVITTNLDGAFYCTRAFLGGMRERRAGTIVNINSDAGKIARDLAGAAYVSSKFGLAGLTQSINAEERANGIRATSIFPRDVNTPLLDKRPHPPSAEARSRMLQPEELAECVWLAATLPLHAIVEEIFISTR